jgi:hypothetical protein
MTMMKAAGEEVKIRNHAVCSPPFPPPNHREVTTPGVVGGVAVGDVVIPNFDFPRKKPMPMKKPPQQAQQAQPPQQAYAPPFLRIDCLELPTKQTREIMRQVSGLGMEDPVFGFSNHSILRTAAKNMPFKNLYNDMKLTDIPADMRDMLTVCSDPTASLHNESWSSFHNSKDLHKELHDSRVGRMLTSSSAMLMSSNSVAALNMSHNTISMDAKVHHQPQRQEAAKQQQPSAADMSKRRQNFVHPFVPPKSVSELVQQEKAEEEMEKVKHQRSQLKQQQELDVTTSKNRPQMDMIDEEKPADRRWGKSTIAMRLQQHKNEISQIRQDIKEDVQVIIPSFQTNGKKNSRNDMYFQSAQNFSFQMNQPQPQRNEDELQLEDLFAAGSPQQQQQRPINAKINRSRLSASDSNLVFNGARGGKSLDALKGMQVNVVEFTRTISGLTMDGSQRTEPSRRAAKEPIIPEHGEEEEEEEDEEEDDLEFDDLMKERSLTLSELMKERSMTLSELHHSTHHTPKQQSDAHEDDHSSSSNLSHSHSLTGMHADPPSRSKKENGAKKASKDHHHHRLGKTNDRQTRLERKAQDSRKSRDASRKSPSCGRQGRSGNPDTKDIQQEAEVRHKPNASSSNWVGPFAVTPGSNQNEGLRFDEQLAPPRRCRSHSLENREGRPSKQALSAAAVHRRPAKKCVSRNADFHDSGMMTSGNESTKANEAKSKFTRYKERTMAIAGGGQKKSRDKSRRSSKQASDEQNNFHMSMGHILNGEASAMQLEAGSKSYGHLDFDMNCS